jgi:predicted flavoprotein YhiN
MVRGEAMIAAYGIEGGAVYALSARLRDAIERDGAARLDVDLRPDLDEATIARRLAAVRAGETLTNRLRRTLNLAPAAIGLLREAHGVALPTDAAALARCVKATPLTATATAPLDRAISMAGGVGFDAVDENLQLHAAPGVFVAGEMLDWEAPTGGYLLQASFATGVAAARGALAWLARGSSQIV